MVVTISTRNQTASLRINGLRLAKRPFLFQLDTTEVSC